MKHFWINIDKSTKRKEFMEKQYEKLGLEHYRVPAITPGDLDNILNHKKPLWCGWKGCKTCPQEYACLCSHIKAIQEGLKTNDEYFVIIEDDIQLPFKIDYENLIKSFPKDAEIVQMLVLYGDTVKHFYRLFLEKSVLYVPYKNLLPSTGIYIISRKGAEKLISKFYNEKLNKYDYNSSPFQKVADVIIYETVKTYAMTLPYAYPIADLGSEIHPDHLVAQSNATAVIKEVIENHNYIPFPFVLEKVI